MQHEWHKNKQRERAQARETNHIARHGLKRFGWRVMTFSEAKAAGFSWDEGKPAS